MSRRIRRTEAGQGGKLGHGRMTHYDYTEVIKYNTRRLRRTQDRTLIREGLEHG